MDPGKKTTCARTYSIYFLKCQERVFMSKAEEKEFSVWIGDGMRSLRTKGNYSSRRW
jgi:hypothetical protein